MQINQQELFRQLRQLRADFVELGPEGSDRSPEDLWGSVELVARMLEDARPLPDIGLFAASLGAVLYDAVERFKNETLDGHAQRLVVGMARELGVLGSDEEHASNLGLIRACLGVSKYYCDWLSRHDLEFFSEYAVTGGA